MKELRLQRSTGQHDQRARIFFTYVSIQNDKCQFFRIQKQEMTFEQCTTTDKNSKDTASVVVKGQEHSSVCWEQSSHTRMNLNRYFLSNFL
jgi:hypothetical protein